jgi:hypothetical protein
MKTLFVDLIIFHLSLICLNLKGSIQVSNGNSDTAQVAEKVYLHIDRVQYTSGEDIWFKAYVIDPSTNKLSLSTNNLHVEIINPRGEIVQSRAVMVFKGTGHGDFSLPDSIPSGKYRIRAYTNYLRNYGEEKFFVKEITIVNPEETEELHLLAREIDNKIDIIFFPEGGSLIDNVTSTIGFKAVNALGKGSDVTVKLYSSSGELITIFNSTHLGMGFFNLKPLPGNKYYAVVQSRDGAETKAPVPESFPSGVAIRTVITPEKNLILTVNPNEATLASLIGKELKVDISLRNLVNKTTKVRIDSLVNNFLIPLEGIPDGVLRVTLSVPEGLPLCERLVFLQRKEDVRLVVTTDKKEYKPREKVTAEISLSGDSTFSDKGEFSMSVTEERLSVSSTPNSRSVASWFLLESDVKGAVEEPGYYFDPVNTKRLLDLDLLLMTQGWRDFKWKYDSVTPYRHEIGFTITGQVRRVLNNNPVEGAKINVALFHLNTTEFMDAKTGKDGKFSFEELDVYGKVRAFLSSTGKLENMQGRIFVDPVIYIPPFAEALRKDTTEIEIRPKELYSYRQEALFRLNTLKKYKLSDTIKIGEVTIVAEKIKTPIEVRVKESRKFYTAPDKELIIPVTAENYAGDIFSYMSGRIAGVQVVRGVNPESPYFPDDVKVFIRGQFSVDNKSSQRSDQGTGNTGFGSTQPKDKLGALILLDGFEVEELSLPSLLMLPMNIVDRIDVLNASPAYGMRGANGVINILTKPGLRREPVKLGPNSVYTSFQGFDVPRIFYSPKHDNKTEQTNAPDFRSTIFWEPDIKASTEKTKLEFYNADTWATMSLTVEGVTEGGLPLIGKLTYKVE